VVVADAAVDAAPLDQDLSRLAERSLAMYQDVAKAFAATGQDCAAATARLRQLAAAYRDVVTANAKVLHDGRAKQLRAALEPHDEAFNRSAQAVVQSPTMSSCSRDAAFAKAFDELLEAPP
jgi:ABC-type transporter Mla subunit MlaD